MKICITAVGTRGDLQPYLALGLGLKEAGHSVKIVSAKNEEAFVIKYGLDFIALDVDIQKIMERGEVNEMAKGNNPIKFILSHLKGSKSLKELMIKTQDEICNACADAEVIIFHPGIPLGFFLAKEKRQIAILATPFPVVSTKDYPSILFYSLPKFGKYYNLLTHYIFDKVFWAMAKSPIKIFWKNHFKTAVDFISSPIKQQIGNGQLLLNGYSQYLFNKPKEWPNNIYTTGNWLLDAEPGFLPSPELIDFINSGDKPIYVGFGSMKNFDDFGKTLELISAALMITKQRAIVSLGWSKNNYANAIPENIF